MTHRNLKTLAAALALAGLATQWPTQALAAELQPLPEPKFNKNMADMGRYLFFDERLSGDAGIACSTCHDPAKGWGDGQAMGKGYPASENFRNTPTILNATLKSRYFWDGRLDGGDAGTLVRDQITEAVFMNMDGRLMQERLKQVPEYNAMWQKFRKDDINGMRVFNVVGEYIKSVRSSNAPIDRFLKGDASALSAEAKAGFDLFNGKGNCVACHNGPVGSDGKLHKTGVPENPALTAEPLRHISLLNHLATNGMPNYMNASTDVGSYAITKAPGDKGKFNTPSIRDLKYTAPYMHNGMFASLDEVIDFYDKGGGAGAALKPLGLSAAEKKALKTFLLEGMSGDPVIVEKPKLPAYQVRVFGKN